MYSIDTLNNGLMALIAGLIISPHCIGMCGPLVCSILPLKAGTGHMETSKALYHLGRALSYTLIGALAGSIGLGLVSAFGLQPIRYFPWVLLVFFLLFAFGLDRWLPAVPGLKSGLSRINRWIHQIAGPMRGLGLGLATPALPCAPLYSVFWVAMVSGSPLLGAEIALGFALGTIPLLWVSQHAYQRFRDKLGRRWLILLQRGFALIAAGLIFFRVLVAGGDPLAVELCTFG